MEEIINQCQNQDCAHFHRHTLQPHSVRLLNSFESISTVQLSESRSLNFIPLCPNGVGESTCELFVIQLRLLENYDNARKRVIKKSIKQILIQPEG